MKKLHEGMEIKRTLNHPMIERIDEGLKQKKKENLKDNDQSIFAFSRIGRVSINISSCQTCNVGDRIVQRNGRCV